MNRPRMILPDHVTFPDLKLDFAADGTVTVDASVVRAVCEESEIDADALLADEEQLAAFIFAWYEQHLEEEDGERDPVADQLLLEAGPSRTLS